MTLQQTVFRWLLQFELWDEMSKSHPYGTRVDTPQPKFSSVATWGRYVYLCEVEVLLTFEGFH